MLPLLFEPLDEGLHFHKRSVCCLSMQVLVWYAWGIVFKKHLFSGTECFERLNDFPGLIPGKTGCSAPSVTMAEGCLTVSSYALPQELVSQGRRPVG